MIRNRIRGIGLAVLFFVGFTMLSASVASACPMCAQALGNSSGGGDLVSGFFWSIVFMMSMPFTILASLGLYFYLQVRRARAAQAALVAQQAAGSGTANAHDPSQPESPADQELVEV